MNLRITLSTANRILTQLRHDRRTLAMLVLVPTLLMVLLRYVVNSQLAFNHVAPVLLGIFPFVMMFIVTSITMLRERTSTTLERLLTMPVGRLDLLVGYALAFGLTTVLQVALVLLISLTWLGLSISGSVAMLAAVALLDAWLGMALGLFVSAFARSEFQAVQFMPLIAMPQVLLCGLFNPRAHMQAVLSDISNVMPLTYAVDALQHVTASSAVDNGTWGDLGIVGGCILLVLVLGAATLRRRTS